MIYTGNMDRECVTLCDAINRIPGVVTIESCCGHGRTTYRIFFRLEHEERGLDYLPILLYYIRACHVGFEWECHVWTDCDMSPAIFILESREKGEVAYQQSYQIAREVNAWLDEHLKFAQDSMSLCGRLMTE